MMTDPVADMLARIRNATLAHLDRTDVPLSKLKERIAVILKAEGYIEGYEVVREPPAKLTLILRYSRGREPAIAGMRRRSRPGRRVYVGHDAIPKVLNGLGVAIVSTSRGLMTDRDARAQRVGGELLCEVW